MVQIPAMGIRRSPEVFQGRNDFDRGERCSRDCLDRNADWISEMSFEVLEDAL